MARKKMKCECGSGRDGYPFQGKTVCDSCLYPGREDWTGGELPELPDCEMGEIATTYVLSGGRTGTELGNVAEYVDTMGNCDAKKMSDQMQKKFYELGFEKKRRYNAWPYKGNGGVDGK